MTDNPRADLAAAPPATRERRMRFIYDGGAGADRRAVLALFYRYGLHMLTDEQLAEAVSMQVADWRERERRNRENRRRATSDYLNRPLRTLEQAKAEAGR